MKIPFFIPWITENDEKTVVKALKQRWLTNGPYLKKFEKKISQFLNSKHAVGCSSATHALHLSLVSLDICKGDEIIVPTLTFASTLDVVRYCGANPVLADVDLETFNILPSEIEKKITKKTRGIIVVHYGGQSCDMKEIIKISKKFNIPIIEDCAHSLGSTYDEKFCGTMGKAGCFSFYPTKIITTGEGGMITTNDDTLFKIVKSLRSHGMTKTPVDREADALWKYDIPKMGYNYRLDEIRAALGYSQMKRIRKINSMRMHIAELYNKEFENISEITVPVVKPDRNHIFHLYTIKVESGFKLNRDQLFKKLHTKGIGSSVQYLPLHLMSYNKNKFKKSDFSNANGLTKKILSLPIFPTMTEKQVKFVVSCFKN